MPTEAERQRMIVPISVDFFRGYVWCICTYVHVYKMCTRVCIVHTYLAYIVHVYYKSPIKQFRNSQFTHMYPLRLIRILLCIYSIFLPVSLAQSLRRMVFFASLSLSLLPFCAYEYYVRDSTANRAVHVCMCVCVCI